MNPISSSAYSSSASLVSRIGTKRKRDGSEKDEKESKELSAKKPKTTLGDLPVSRKPIQTGGLCEDAWIQILQYLPAQEIYAAWTRVDKYFNYLAPRTVTEIVLPGIYRWHTPTALRIPFLGIKNSPLRQIYIRSYSEYPSSALSLLKPFPLESLSFWSACAIDSSLEQVVNQTTLKTLNICFCTLSEATIKSLKAFSLTSLKLFCNGLQNSSLAYFPATLEKLDLSFNRDISSLAALNTPKLKELHLSHTSLTDGAMKHLQSFPSLNILDLASCFISNGLGWITGHQIRILSLAGTDISDDNLLQLPQSLTGLSLRSCFNITNTGMKHLAKLALTALDLGDLYIDDLGVANLGNMLALKKLDLSRTKISDTALSTLSKFTSLQYLNLQCCLIKVDSLKHLIDLPLTTIVFANSAFPLEALLTPAMRPLFAKISYKTSSYSFNFLTE